MNDGTHHKSLPQLRQAEESDAERIYGLLQPHFFWVDNAGSPHGYIKEYPIEEQYETIARGQVLVVEQYALIVATGALLPRELNPGEIDLEAARIFTDKSFRRQRLMRMIIGGLEEKAYEQGATQVIATSREAGLIAFKKMGYTPEAMDNRRQELVCNGCKLLEVCPETYLVKNLPSTNGYHP